MSSVRRMKAEWTRSRFWVLTTCLARIRAMTQPSTSCSSRTSGSYQEGGAHVASRTGRLRSPQAHHILVRAHDLAKWDGFIVAPWDSALALGRPTMSPMTLAPTHAPAPTHLLRCSRNMQRTSLWRLRHQPWSPSIFIKIDGDDDANANPSSRVLVHLMSFFISPRMSNYV
jgi:hypothetical protein